MIVTTKKVVVLNCKIIGIMISKRNGVLAVTAILF